MKPFKIYLDTSVTALDTIFCPQMPYLYCWQLDETSGLTASDATGHGNSATLHGNPVWSLGKYGNALTFDGVDDYLSTSVQQTTPNVFTLSLWFRTTSSTGGKLIGFGEAKTGTSGSYDRHLYMDNAGKIYFGCYNGNVQTISTAGAFNNGEWHHAAATLSDAGMMLYVDGSLVGSKTSVISGDNYSGYWRIGYDALEGWTNRPSSDYFKGQLDDIQIYDKALSASEIALLYDGGTENEPVIITPENFVLTALPNPFNPSVNISYCLSQKAKVSLILYNLQGKIVKDVAYCMTSAGKHTVQINAGKLASGIYVCEFKGGATTKRLKLVLMR